MKCVIAEKPSVAASYAKVIGARKRNDGYFEGNGYIVTWCYGHLVRLAYPEEYEDQNWGKPWSLGQLPMIPKDYKRLNISGISEKQFRKVKQLINSDKVTSLVCGTDAGREGELIFRLVYEQAGCKKPFERLWLNSLTDEDIRIGFQNLKSGRDYDDLYKSALGRLQADWLFGMNMSRLLSVKGKDNLPCGRVQSPTLAMIVDRHNEVTSFKKYFTYKLQSNVNGVDFQSDEFEDKANALAVMNHYSGKDFQVVSANKQNKIKNPPHLFDLGSLQKKCSEQYGFTSKRTLQIAQTLYEKKFTSYPRSDTKYINESMKDEVFEIACWILQNHSLYKGKDMIPDFSRSIDDSKVTDHTAIIPTRQYIKNKYQEYDQLSSDEKKVFDTIAIRFIASAAPLQKYETRKVILKNNDLVLSASGKKILDPGYLIYEKEEQKEKDATGLDRFEEHQTYTLSDLSIKEVEKKPKSEYTDSTILTAMENAASKDFKAIDGIERIGLGTSATRADVIESLIKHKYIIREGKKLIPTDKGIYLVGILRGKMTSPELSVEWETQLADIKKGKRSIYDFMNDCEREISQMTEEYKNRDIAESKKETNTQRQEVGPCPICGGMMHMIETSKGTWYICENNVKDKEGACTGMFGKNFRYFDQTLSVPISKAKKLLKGEEVKFKLKAKDGHQYEAPMVLKVNKGKNGRTYFNLERVKKS
jgi:DNA topoisomerase-3